MSLSSNPKVSTPLTPFCFYHPLQMWFNLIACQVVKIVVHCSLFRVLCVLLLLRKSRDLSVELSSSASINASAPSFPIFVSVSKKSMWSLCLIDLDNESFLTVKVKGLKCCILHQHFAQFNHWFVTNVTCYSCASVISISKAMLIYVLTLNV